MTRWLLNNLSTWQLAVVIVGGLGVLAVAGLVLVRRSLPHLTQTPINDVAGVIVGVVAAVYGIILAFIIVALYEQFSEAQVTVRTEASQLSQLYENTQVFPPQVHRRMRNEVRAYAAAVRDEEWSLMREGRESADAWRHVGDLYGVLERYNPRTSAQSAFYDQAVSRLNDLIASRRERLSDAADELPSTFQVLLFGGAVLLIGSLYLLGLPSARMQTAMVLSVALLTGFNLLLAVVLDHPFSGEVAVSSSPFTQGSLGQLDPTLASARGR
ncbi:MAG: DUF4239 domain-containing protein [Actinomycetota bacterium]|nr:DUF4239 domain-containing protein [Actinomycetota bacterium]